MIIESILQKFRVEYLLFVKFADKGKNGSGSDQSVLPTIPWMQEVPISLQYQGLMFCRV